MTVVAETPEEKRHKVMQLIWRSHFRDKVHPLSIVRQTRMPNKRWEVEVICACGKLTLRAQAAVRKTHEQILKEIAELYKEEIENHF